MRIKARTKETIAAYGFLAPNLIGFMVFTFIPVFISLILSFFKWDILTTPQFIGFENFSQLLGFHKDAATNSIVANDPKFWQYLWNTVFLMFSIPVCMMASLGLAIALNRKVRGESMFRTIFFLPSICPGVAISILWLWIFNPEYGMLNNIIYWGGKLLGFSLQGPLWLNSPGWAKPALMLMNFWIAIGGMNMILYLAALQGIPRDFYEAAEIDGANGWQKFWAITWPQISPTTFFIAIMSIIGGFQGGFMQAYIMTGGGPGGATTTIEYYIFNNLYTWQNVGYAAAIAWFLFMVIFVVSLVNWRFGGKLVHY
ncbi:MAG TPA: sugar ABC transporter permease [Candidatus Omnitrophota bacterium]|nr:sugar ABC transporter permease [Candidatus Omnitrophota bacterium]HOX09071.1 sugar ABC transporter permease [Candidatus Omnitrophota bacterium]HPN66591.1 sugar ABC transporter permease [Candidatus Omnitrophota bacterium]